MHFNGGAPSKSHVHRYTNVIDIVRCMVGNTKVKKMKNTNFAPVSLKIYNHLHVIFHPETEGQRLNIVLRERTKQWMMICFSVK